MIAEQMTLLESEMYCKITPRECIAHLKSKNKEAVCIYIYRPIFFLFFSFVLCFCFFFLLFFVSLLIYVLLSGLSHFAHACSPF